MFSFKGHRQKSCINTKFISMWIFCKTFDANFYNVDILRSACQYNVKMHDITIIQDKYEHQPREKYSFVLNK